MKPDILEARLTVSVGANEPGCLGGHAIFRRNYYRVISAIDSEERERSFTRNGYSSGPKMEAGGTPQE